MLSVRGRLLFGLCTPPHSILGTCTCRVLHTLWAVGMSEPCDTSCVALGFAIIAVRKATLAFLCLVLRQSGCCPVVLRSVVSVPWYNQKWRYPLATCSSAAFEASLCLGNRLAICTAQLHSFSISFHRPCPFACRRPWIW